MEVDDSFKLNSDSYNSENVKNNATFKPRFYLYIIFHSGKDGVLGKIRRIFFKQTPACIAWLKGLNVNRGAPKPEINVKTRAKLAKEFTPIVKEIEYITGRKLPNWHQ